MFFNVKCLTDIEKNLLLRLYMYIKQLLGICHDYWQYQTWNICFIKAAL